MELAILHFYASMGWRLFPCRERHSGRLNDNGTPKEDAKAPLTHNGFYDATCSLSQIEEWHRQYPDAAWGTPTSAERGVIDIDPRHGGDAALARLEHQHGPLPLTPKVRTGGGGWHYWLHFPPGTKCGLVAEGIDRKCDGGYVIVPPSVIAIPEHEGRCYAWAGGCKPWEGVPLAEAPAWAVSNAPLAVALCAAAPHRERRAAVAEALNPWVVRAAGEDLLTHPGSPEGERRKTLVRLAGVHLARGDSEGTIYALAEAWAKHCQPPFEEWRKHVDGLLRKEQAKALKMTTPSPPTPCKVSVSFAEDKSDTLLPDAANYLTNSEPDGLGSLLVSSQAPGDGGQGGRELVSSFAPSAYSETGSGVGCHPPGSTLPPEAYHGLFGEMLKAVSPHTEADPAGVLLGWLTCFGSVVGRGAWAYSAEDHYPVLFVANVGKPSCRKGVGFGLVKWPFEQVEPKWAGQCVAHGFGSGQGLIERVADEQQTIDGDGKVKVIPGASDKRCLFRLDELAVCFKLQRSENSTLQENLLTAWGGTPLQSTNCKANARRATGYSISVIGDTQPGTLAKLLSGGKGMEQFNGWMNRFLWVWVERRGRHPRPPKHGPILMPFLNRLASALAFAKGVGEVGWDGEADALWDEVYDALATSADSVPHTGRAEGYATRLALLYALADEAKIIRAEHLQAALALWSYCRASARMLFGEAQGCAAQPHNPPQPDPLWLQVLNAIGRSPGVSRKGLHEAFHNRLKADELDGALEYLERSGLAYKRTVQAEGGGRPAECWHPMLGPDGEGEGDAEGEGDEVDNPLTPPASEEPKGTSQTCTLCPEPKGIAESDTLADPPPEAVASADACELTNYLPEGGGVGPCEECERTNYLPAPAPAELVSSFAEPDAQAPAPAELVSSFADAQEQTADDAGEKGLKTFQTPGVADERGGASGVVSREAEPQGNAFAYEAQGGFGVSGEPVKPYWPLPSFNVQPDGFGGFATTPAFHADAPPSGEAMDAAYDADDFLRRLDAADD